MKRAVVAIALSIAACGAAFAQYPARASEVLYVHGSAVQPHRIYTPQELAAMPPETIGEFSQSRGQPGAETRTTIRGVKLVRLIERMGLAPAARNDWKNLLVSVTATDGYRAHFTWTELSNTAAGESVLVVFERDGKPLEPREGLIALQAPADLRLGARHVRNALRIEVRAVAD